MSLVVEMKPQLWQTPADGLWYQGPGVGGLHRHPPPPYPPCPFPGRPTTQRVGVHLEVPLAVGLGSEGRQADETHEGALAWNTGPSEGP